MSFLLFLWTFGLTKDYFTHVEIQYRVLYGDLYELKNSNIDSGLAFQLTSTPGVDSLTPSTCINPDCTSPTNSFLHSQLFISHCFYDAPALLCAIVDSNDARFLHFQRVQDFVKRFFNHKKCKILLAKLRSMALYSSQ